MNTKIVLVMHGVPPRDFPKSEIAELMGLHSRLESAAIPPHERPALEARFRDLDSRVRNWPRSAANDTFYMASQNLAAELGRITKCEVVLGFNEFCAPALPHALDTAASSAERVMVVTPMLTPGGEHSEVEIPAHIEEARARHPQVEFVYAWPFAVSDVAKFLASHMNLDTAS